MWLGSNVFLVGGKTRTDTANSDFDLFEPNAEFYVLDSSGAFVPFRDFDWNHFAFHHHRVHQE